MKKTAYVPRWPPFTFGGVENPSIKESKVVIIPVPFDSTQSYRPGSRNGPESIIDASRYMELFDHETGFSPCDIGIHTMRGIEPARGSVEDSIDRIRQVVSEVLCDGKFPVLLGGEHTITIGAVSAAAHVWKDLRVLVLDAHCDLRNEYEGSKYSHACTNRRVSEMVGRHIVAGIRSCSEEEWEMIEARNLSFYFWKEGDRKNSLLNLGRAFNRALENPDQPLYLSIDLDVFNPSELPAVGTPEPSGPSYDDLLPFIRTLARKANLVGMDLVELTPIPNDDRSQFLAAKLVYKIIGYHFGPNHSRSAKETR